MSEDQHIYVMTHHELERKTPIHRERGTERNVGPAEFHKIGRSTNPQFRLGQLQAGTPNKLKLQTVVKTNSPKQIERLLHDLYSERHQTGEWYDLTLNAEKSLNMLERLEIENLKPVVKRKWDWLRSKKTNLYGEIMEERKDE